ncbi:hypothetical protein FA10DRAFT_263217 [Acaromyces ingoldii]|uniref:Uncharacterized protein n=1 Tax=Acaromyces ingoldii TaxID=215250 RepID=A0A316YAS8_9BASI|nr:hypothetical protein FA10DRAFT_263217 [Acaromyces ingoldii]PWN86717.1 hypothetical protein FA10DRAFT_263217 [Acaromyces ingoldii]
MTISRHTNGWRAARPRSENSSSLLVVALSAQTGQRGYYGAYFKGYQGTLLAQRGAKVCAKSYVEGAVDFFFGQHIQADFLTATSVSRPAVDTSSKSFQATSDAGASGQRASFSKKLSSVVDVTTVFGSSCQSWSDKFYL